MCPNTEFFLVSGPKRTEPTNFTNYDMVVLPKCRSKHGAFTERSKNFKAAISEVFYKEGVLEGFEIFTGKHLCQGLFFNKVGSGGCFCYSWEHK